MKKLAKSLGQTDMRGLQVDETLKVKGANGVYAIGDAALSGFAPTAQVAAQQGKHIGRAIRDSVDSKFEYSHCVVLAVTMALLSCWLPQDQRNLMYGMLLVLNKLAKMETNAP